MNSRALHQRLGTSGATCAVLFVVAILSSLAPATASADFAREFEFDGESLSVGNLIGAITLEASDNGKFQVVVDVRGEDASEELISFETDEGDDAVLFVRFPTEESRRYVYPELGRSKSQISFRNEGRRDGVLSSFFRELGRKKIEVSGRGRGLEVWADIVIRVPADSEIRVRNGVGSIEAKDVEAQTKLMNQSGPIYADGIGGDLICDTGSGHVEVHAVTGDLLVDTGSGHVEVSDVKGKSCNIDTGSGHVALANVEADEVLVDTGSGKVELEDVNCHDLSVDTGSGGVRADGLHANDVEIDTGSGSVRLELVEMGEGGFTVDTGSGSITMIVPESASANFRAHAGSGGVDVDIDDIDVHRVRRDSIDFDMGSGSAEVLLETSSGGIRIAAR